MKLFLSSTALVTFALITAPSFAQDAPEGGQVGEMTISSEDMRAPSADDFSPYAGRDFPTRPLWGDTHLHTSISLDARAFGVILSPADAFRFARGEEVTTSHGLRARLSMTQPDTINRPATGRICISPTRARSKGLPVAS